MYKKLIILCIWTLVVDITVGQNLKFDKLKVEDGLTSVNAILIDQYGFSWFGGTHGLYRHDGTEFISFHHNPEDSSTLSSDNIIALYEDAVGNIWIGTEGKGLNVYRPDLETIERIRFKERSLNRASIAAVCDAGSQIWLGTKGAGIYVVDSSFHVMDHITHAGQGSRLSNNDVFDIQKNAEGIWVSTNGGSIDFFGPDGELHFKYSDYDLHGVRTGQKIALTKNEIWIGTEGQGLYVFDMETRQFKSEFVPSRFMSSAITDLETDSKGGIWFSTDGDGVIYFNSENGAFEQYRYEPEDEFGLTNNASYSLAIDASDRVWLGMGDGVVNISSNSTLRYIRPNHGLGFRVVVDLTIEDETLWAATGGGGVTKIDLRNDEFINFNSQSHQNILSDIALCVKGDQKGGAWFGTFLGGLYHVDVNNRLERFSTSNGLSNDHIFDIEVSERTIWAATQGGGVSAVDVKTGEVTVFNTSNLNGLLSDRIQSLFLKGNLLWMGHYSGGIQILDISSGLLADVSSYLGEDMMRRLKEYPVHDIQIDSENTVWVATGGAGLIKAISPNDYSIITMEDGLPSNSIYGVYRLGGFVYLGTNRGIGIIEVGSEKITSLDKDYGLLTSDFESGGIASFQEELFFSSKEGILRLAPASLSKPGLSKPPLLTQLKVLGRTVKPKEKVDGLSVLDKSIVKAKTIKLPYSRNNFSIHFSTPGFRNTELAKYRYKMAGLDNDWINISDDSKIIPFSDLKDGQYTLTLEVLDVNGIWNEARKIDVVITPPLYRSRWAYVVYGFIGLVLAYLAYFLIRWRVRMQNQLKFEKYSREKDNELNDQKINFFTGVSHELRTPLTLLIGPLEQLVKNPKLDNRLRNRVMGMQKNASRLMLLINQLLDFRKMESGKMKLQVSQQDLLQFAEEILLTFRELALQRGMELEFVNKLTRRLFYFDETKIEIILYNLLSNALKFTEIGGKVSVELSDLGNEIQMIVRDTGKGISQENVENIFDPFFRDRTLDKNEKGSGIGLALVRNVVELHHGEIKVESEISVGSCFTVRIPCEKSSYSSDELLKMALPDSAESINQQETAYEPLSEEEKSRVLVVEDNKEIREFILDHLKLEFEMFVAVDGKQGLELAREIVPDIILSDVMMPIMDGIEMCRHLKTEISTSHIPIILLTARSGFTHELSGLDTGADDYITKPFQVEILRVRLHNLLDNRRKLREKIRKDLILEPSEVAVSDPDEQFLGELMGIIESNISDSDFSVKDLAHEMGLSHSVLYRKILALTSLTINDFIKTVRLKRAAQLLLSNSHRINEISYMVGFSNPKYFSTCFKEYFGTTPKEYLIQRPELT